MNIYLRTIPVWISIILSAACAAKDSLKTVNDLGWLHGNCLAIRNSNLSNGQKLSILLLDEKNHFANGKITGTAVSGDCAALLNDRKVINQDAGFSFYKVSTPNTIDLAIGVLMEDRNSFDTNVLHNPDNFAYCTSSEGIVFSLWDKGAYGGKKLWSEYYLLGYETESNCPEKVQDN